MKLIGVISISIILCSLINVSYQQVTFAVKNSVVQADKCDFIQENFGTITNIDKDCDVLCKNIPDCTHWVLKKDDKTCNLKKGKTSVSKATNVDADTVCGFSPNFCTSVDMCKRIKVKPDAWKSNGQRVYAVGCDFADVDISVVIHENNNCGPVCDNTTSCTHWTFIKDPKGTDNDKTGSCHLKKGDVDIHKAIQLASITDVKKQVCGFSNAKCPSTDKCLTDVDDKAWRQIGDDDNGFFIVAPGCDFNTPDIQIINNVNDCGPRCNKIDDCTHFTLKDGNCHFKKGEIGINDAIKFGTETDVTKQSCGFRTNQCVREVNPVVDKARNLADTALALAKETNVAVQALTTLVGSAVTSATDNAANANAKAATDSLDNAKFALNKAVESAQKAADAARAAQTAAAAVVSAVAADKSITGQAITDAGNAKTAADNAVTSANTARDAFQAINDAANIDTDNAANNAAQFTTDVTAFQTAVTTLSTSTTITDAITNAQTVRDDIETVVNSIAGSNDPVSVCKAIANTV